MHTFEINILVQVLNCWRLLHVSRARSSIVAKGLRYKPAGRRFDSRWCHIFQRHNPSGCTMVLGSKPGCRHGKLFIGKPSKKRTEDLLKLGRRQLKMAVAILTRHVPVRGHLRNMSLYDGDPSCRFCGMETETVWHLLCCCESLARQRYNFFGKLFSEPSDISTASVRDLCLFLRVAGLLNLSWI
jgi:hypothetical protein